MNQKSAHSHKHILHLHFKNDRVVFNFRFTLIMLCMLCKVHTSWSILVMKSHRSAVWDWSVRWAVSLIKHCNSTVMLPLSSHMNMCCRLLIWRKTLWRCGIRMDERLRSMRNCLSLKECWLWRSLRWAAFLTLLSRHWKHGQQLTRWQIQPPQAFKY